MSAHQYTVVATPRFFDAHTKAFLEQQGCRVLVPELDPASGDSNFSAAKLIALASEADGWLLGQARLDAQVIAALPRLRVIARRGVGYERVDLEAARARGIFVTIGTGGNDASTADHALALMLGTGRRLRESHQAMAGGHWGILVGSELFGKTVGIVGLGRVGRGVVQRLKGFSCTMLIATPRPDPALAADPAIRFVALPELLAQSDYVSLHLPLTPATRHLIDAEALALMKPTAIIINTARGGLIDEPALLEALRDGRIGGAGLDVFMAETDDEAKPVAEALLALRQVSATPHAAGSTHEALMRTNMIAARTIVDVLSGRAPPPETIVIEGRLGPGAG